MKQSSKHPNHVMLVYNTHHTVEGLAIKTYRYLIGNDPPGNETATQGYRGF